MYPDHANPRNIGGPHTKTLVGLKAWDSCGSLGTSEIPLHTVRGACTRTPLPARNLSFSAIFLLTNRARVNSKQFESLTPESGIGFRNTSSHRLYTPMPTHQTPPSSQGASQQTRLQTGMYYRGTSLIRNRTPLGPHGRHTPTVLWGSQGGRRFLMGEVPLQTLNSDNQNEPSVEASGAVQGVPRS